MLEGKAIRHLPNALTMLRIAGTPAVMLLLFSDTLGAHVWALVLFVLASISDYLDGAMARKYGVHSRWGQFLDPLADKILVLGTFGALAMRLPSIVPWWAVAVIALRDVGITFLRMWAESHGRSLRTLPMAKAKTMIQLIFLIGILVMLVCVRLPGYLGRVGAWVLAGPIPFIVLMAVVVITAFTGILYAYRMEYASTNA